MNNNDKRNAVAKFFGISPSEVSIDTVSGYDGPVTEAVIDGNTFWIWLCSTSVDMVGEW